MLTRDIAATGYYNLGFGGNYFNGSERWKDNLIFQDFRVLLARSASGKTRIQVKYKLSQEYLRYQVPGSYAEPVDSVCDTGAIINYSGDFTTNFCGTLSGWTRQDCVCPTINDISTFPTVKLWGKYGPVDITDWDTGWLSGDCATVLVPTDYVQEYAEYNSNPSFSLPFRSCAIPLTGVNSFAAPCGGSRYFTWRTWATWTATNRVTFTLC
jgi:hypothetical protein